MPLFATENLGGSLGESKAVDPFFSNVVLLIDADGTDASTTIIDESSTGHTLTAFGDAQLDTAQKKFGASSLLLDGVGDYVDSALSTEHDFGSGDFTIEYWLRQPTESAGFEDHISKWHSVTDGKQWLMQYGPSNNAFSLFISKDGVNAIEAAWYDFDNDELNTGDFFDGEFHHIAGVRHGDDFDFYLDAFLGGGGSTVTGALFANTTKALRIGGRLGGTPVQPTKGHFDDIRITKGLARYTAPGFALPAFPFPRFGP